MMNIKNIYFQFAILCLLLLSCNLNTSNDFENRDNSKVEELKKQKIDEDEKKVIGDIKFGVNETEFNKQLDEFLKKSIVKNKAYKYINEYEIGEFKFRKAEGSFHQDRLYYFQITGELIHWEDYSIKLLGQLEKIHEILKKKYGSPNEGLGPIDRYQIEKDHFYLNYNWNIGTKTIQVRTSENGLYYEITVYIFQPHINEIIKKENDSVSLNTADKAKDLF